MTTLRNVFNRIHDYLRYKLYSAYKRKYYSLFLKLWKLPKYIMSYQSAVMFAEYEIKDSHKRIEKQEYIIERLIEQLIIEFTDQLGMSEKEAYREAYQLAYEYDTWINHIPSKYLTEEEAEDKFERDLDNHVTYDPIADASCTQMMDYELSQLKKGGVYETSY